MAKRNNKSYIDDDGDQYFFPFARNMRYNFAIRVYYQNTHTNTYTCIHIHTLTHIHCKHRKAMAKVQITSSSTKKRRRKVENNKKQIAKCNIFIMIKNEKQSKAKQKRTKKLNEINKFILLYKLCCNLKTKRNEK